MTDDLRDRIESRERAAPLLPMEMPPRSSPPQATASAADDYEHTAQRFLDRRPEAAGEVVRLLAEGASPVVLARSYRIGVGTVLALRRRAAPELEAESKVVAARARDVALSAIEAADEALRDPERRRKISPRDAAITAGILIQRSQEIEAAQAGAGAGGVSAGAGAGAGHEDYLRELAALGAGVAVGMGMGFGAARARQRAAEAGGGIEAEAGGGADGREGPAIEAEAVAVAPDVAR